MAIVYRENTFDVIKFVQTSAGMRRCGPETPIISVRYLYISCEDRTPSLDLKLKLIIIIILINNNNLLLLLFEHPALDLKLNKNYTI